uniref:COesterase domain-containing protein n=1 Tax=Macrostomum lignano TaxID=282301 RepID=A0A1I8F8Z3_9PLAT
HNIVKAAASACCNTDEAIPAHQLEPPEGKNLAAVFGRRTQWGIKKCTGELRVRSRAETMAAQIFIDIGLALKSRERRQSAWSGSIAKGKSNRSGWKQISECKEATYLGADSAVSDGADIKATMSDNTHLGVFNVDKVGAGEVPDADVNNSRVYEVKRAQGLWRDGINLRAASDAIYTRPAVLVSKPENCQLENCEPKLQPENCQPTIASRQLPVDNCQSTIASRENCQPENCQPTTASRQLPVDNCQPRKLPAGKLPADNCQSTTASRQNKKPRAAPVRRFVGSKTPRVIAAAVLKTKLQLGTGPIGGLVLGSGVAVVAAVVVVEVVVEVMAVVRLIPEAAVVTSEAIRHVVARRKSFKVDSEVVVEPVAAVVLGPDFLLVPRHGIARLNKLGQVVHHADRQIGLLGFYDRSIVGRVSEEVVRVRAMLDKLTWFFSDIFSANSFAALTKSRSEAPSSHRLYCAGPDGFPKSVSRSYITFCPVTLITVDDWRKLDALEQTVVVKLLVDKLLGGNLTKALDCGIEVALIRKRAAELTDGKVQAGVVPHRPEDHRRAAQHDGSLEVRLRIVVQHVVPDGCSSGVQTHQRHRLQVSSEPLDVFMHELESQGLILQAHVSRRHGRAESKKAEYAKSVLETHGDDRLNTARIDFFDDGAGLEAASMDPHEHWVASGVRGGSVVRRPDVGSDAALRHAISMASTLTTLLLLLALSAAAVSAQRNFTIVRYLNVTTTQGPIRGAVIETKGSGDKNMVHIGSFLGINFAKVPTGEFRFAHPVFTKWDFVQDVLDFDRRCYQDPGASGDYQTMSESCIAANIWTPYNGTSSNPGSYPVLVWIHGGRFETGSIIEEINSGRVLTAHESIVTVSLQYRLGVLGFLRLSSTVAPGNMGLKDQALGLEFVHKNIERFGGNLQTVTLMGLDAGAAAVGYHMLNDNTKTYFKRAVMLGGSPMVFWSVRQSTTDVERLHAKFAREKLNCDPDRLGLDEALKCLREVGPEALINAQKEFIKDFQGIEFPPVIDGDYIKEDPVVALRGLRFEPKQLIIGFTNSEAATYVESSLRDKGWSKEDLQDPAKYRSVIEDNFRTYEREPDIMSTAARKFMTDRFTSFSNPSAEVNFRRWLDAASDRLFVCAANEFADLSTRVTGQ